MVSTPVIRSLYLHMDYYSFTNTLGMEGWVGRQYTTTVVLTTEPHWHNITGSTQEVGLASGGGEEEEDFHCIFSCFLKRVCVHKVPPSTPEQFLDSYCDAKF